MQNTSLNAIYLSTLQKQNFVIALSRFFLYQNRDGSWGQGSIENKVTLTSQAIQLMHALRIGHDDKAFRKATRWMEDNIKKGNPHWATRLEIGLKIGEFEKLADDHHIDVFLSDLEVSLSSTNPANKSQVLFKKKYEVKKADLNKAYFVELKLLIDLHYAGIVDTQKFIYTCHFYNVFWFAFSFFFQHELVDRIFGHLM